MSFIIGVAFLNSVSKEFDGEIESQTTYEPSYYTSRFLV